jgi:hypothetical protein
MSRELQIYHHLGLGDHIICNGLVRRYCKSYERIYLFVKHVNVESVAFMYRNEPKIILVPVKDDDEVPLRTNDSIPLIRVGFEYVNTSSRNFDESFYRQVGLEFDCRWSDFALERDYSMEMELFNTLNPNCVPYALVHDDPSRGFSLDLTYVTKDLRIIRPSDCMDGLYADGTFKKYNLFHWILVLERAREIHCMDSAFKCLVESLVNVNTPRLVYHRYVRGAGPRFVSSMRKDWVTIARPSIPFMTKHVIVKIQNKIAKELAGSTASLQKSVR